MLLTVVIIAGGGIAEALTSKDQADLLNFCPDEAAQKGVAARSGNNDRKLRLHH